MPKCNDFDHFWQFSIKAPNSILRLIQSPPILVANRRGLVMQRNTSGQPAVRDAVVDLMRRLGMTSVFANPGSTRRSRLGANAVRSEDSRGRRDTPNRRWP